MTERPGIYVMTESPFKVYESYDLDIETPKSSLYSNRLNVKKAFNFNKRVFDEHGNKASSWTQLFLNKHPLQIRAESLNTPPAIKSPGIEPLAPIKLRRSINKADLKPKKLVFKDREDHESEIVQLLSPLRVRSETKLKPRKDDEGLSEITKINNIIRQNRAEDSMTSRRQKQPPSDDKENRMDDFFRMNNRNQIATSRILPLKSGSNVLTSIQLKKSNTNNSGIKNLRI